MIITGLIPARFASSRFPGKPLALIGGKPMIQMVYEKAQQALDLVYVATDDKTIARAVESFGGNVIMTSVDHRSGTDRCAEAVKKLEKKFHIKSDVVINIQGDEPFIKPSQISLLADCFYDYEVNIATLVKIIDNPSDLVNSNKPKVVIAENGDALYFSRAAIPFRRDTEIGQWLNTTRYYKHVGMYGYRTSTLLEISALKPSSVEIAESLEQLRWLSHGYHIRTVVTDWESLSIDTPDDLENAKVLLKRPGN
jgi:3-deoxy-manno-octulosonate cytidylyltransferase (CMP-KDO synthetase)